MDAQLQPVFQSILDGQHKDIILQVEKVLQNGVSPKIILEEGMIAAMAEVGRLFEAGMQARRSTKSGLPVLAQLVGLLLGKSQLDLGLEIVQPRQLFGAGQMFAEILAFL